MKRNISLSVLSGLMLWLAWPPMPYSTFLLFIGFVPMLVAMENIIQSESVRKGKKIFWTTFLGFFIWNTLSVYWVFNALKEGESNWVIPVTIIPYSLAPLLMSTCCWLYYRLRRFTKRNLAFLGLICFWIGYEYLNQTWDLNFPWMTLGNGFAVKHKWVQWYEFTGVYGGTLWVWVVNIFAFLVYSSMHRPRAKVTRLKQILAFGLIILLPIAYSLYRYRGYHEESNPSNIVVVQPNIDPYLKQGAMSFSQQIGILSHLSDSLGQHNTEFFIWPETAIPEPVNEDAIRVNNNFLAIKHFLSKYKNGNVLTGAETYKIYNSRQTNTAEPYDPQGNQYYDRFNSAVNIENSAEVQIYHKSKLVPGAESMPFGDALSFLKPVFEHLGGATGDYGIQDEPAVFYSQSGIGVTPVVCYESVWGEWLGTSVHKGGQFISIITDDAWWGDTAGKDQDLDYAKIRAIETRRWVCRSANTGLSAFINQRGDVVQQTEWWKRTAIKQNINLNSELTFYVIHGDYIARTASFMALGGIFLILVIKINALRKRKIAARA